MMGLGVSLPKFLPASNEKEQIEIHYSALVLVTFLFSIVGVTAVFGSSYFSEIVFGDFHHEKMLFVILFYVLALMYHATVYNFFRGQFNYKLSSLLQLINLGILPFLMYFFAVSVEQYFLLLSSGILLVVVVANMIFIPLKDLREINLKITFRKLVSYGIQRMPGDVLLGLLFAVPVYVVSNKHSLEIAGSVAFSLSLFNVVIALMSPLNIILLPEASKIITEKQSYKLVSIGNKLLYLSLTVGFVALFVVVFFGEFVLSLFNIEELEYNAKLLVIVFTGVLGYSVFSIIRSLVDAYFERAMMTLIIGGAFLIYMIILSVLQLMNLSSVHNVLIGLSTTVNLMGLFTFFALQMIFKRIK